MNDEVKKEDVVLTASNAPEKKPEQVKGPVAPARNGLEDQIRRVEGMVRFIASKIPGATEELDSIF